MVAGSPFGARNLKKCISADFYKIKEATQVEGSRRIVGTSVRSSKMQELASYDHRPNVTMDNSNEKQKYRNKFTIDIDLLIGCIFCSNE